jgi:hypothetical protein
MSRSQDPLTGLGTMWSNGGGQMEEALLEAARAIRPYLDELVGGEAKRFDEEIAALLDAASTGEDVTGSLRSLLGSHEATDDWVAEVVEDPLHRPPDYQPVGTRGFDLLPGLVGPVAAGKYACPHGDFIWYRPSVGVRVPPCPSHGPGLASVSD